MKWDQHKTSWNHVDVMLMMMSLELVNKLPVSFGLKTLQVISGGTISCVKMLCFKMGLKLAV